MNTNSQRLTAHESHELTQRVHKFGVKRLLDMLRAQDMKGDNEGEHHDGD
ncbi:hypothetical protein OPW41_08855 [Vibrio europaeus]|nr:hypothetical protein [Vibrio europaeus]MDC5755216.1 hypothetical protein [Vibrio europaeus]MDC5775795.1 hypothetical protein [Vibrio europaeus]MDC5794933.1 hypothetical protein [Vibrio europaeus]MDC5799504.1 hypothetical protein [Vibrio europaeus]MDC5817212.1 hypothetical protein [Vibrio europaeus]